jgi:hypothetical protein
MGLPTLGTAEHIIDGHRRGVVIDVTPDDDYDQTDGIPVRGDDVGLGIITDARVEQTVGDTFLWRYSIENEALRAYARSGNAQVRSIAQVVDHSEFADGGGASGTITLDEQLPANALVVAWTAVVSEGFAGDTTAVAKVGTTGDDDRFSAQTTGSVLNTGTVGSGPLAADVLDGVAAAQNLVVTVTGGADWGNITAGTMTVTVFYLDLGAGGVGSVSETLTITAAGGAPSFTDNTNTTGFADLGTTIPAGSLVLGWTIQVVAAPTGADVTTVTAMVGVAGDTDRFSADTSKSVAAVGTVGSAPLAADVLDSPTGAITPRVTLTEGDDFTDIETLTLIATVYYLDLAAGGDAFAEVPEGTDLSGETVRLTLYGI